MLFINPFKNGIFKHRFLHFFRSNFKNQFIYGQYVSFGIYRVRHMSWYDFRRLYWASEWPHKNFVKWSYQDYYQNLYFIQDKFFEKSFLILGESLFYQKPFSIWHTHLVIVTKLLLKWRFQYCNDKISKPFLGHFCNDF